MNLCETTVCKTFALPSPEPARSDGAKRSSGRMIPETSGSESLKTMVNNSTELPEEYWQKLQPLYAPDSDGWRNALNQAANNIGFSNKSNSFSFLLRNLVDLLPHSVAA
jgi:hypothetical protein